MVCAGCHTPEVRCRHGRSASAADGAYATLDTTQTPPASNAMARCQQRQNADVFPYRICISGGECREDDHTESVVCSRKYHASRSCPTVRFDLWYRIWYRIKQWVWVRETRCSAQLIHRNSHRSSPARDVARYWHPRACPHGREDSRCPSTRR